MAFKYQDKETFVITRGDDCNDSELIAAFVRAVNAKDTKKIVPGMLGEDGRDRPIGEEPPELPDLSKMSCIVVGAGSSYVEDDNCRIIKFSHANVNSNYIHRMES